MKRVYLFHEMSIVERMFQKLFGVSFAPFYDRIVSSAFKRLSIDMDEFDDWLHSQVGAYEFKGKSMREVVREKYGEDAVELINSLL